MKLDLDFEKDRLERYGRKKLTEWKLEKVWRRLRILRRFAYMKDVETDTRQTRNGIHVRISFSTDLELEDRDIVFFQLMLMSDWKREMFNWLRVIHGFDRWNALFKRKYKSEIRDGKFSLKKIGEEDFKENES